MCRKLTCLASLVLLLGAVNSALALGPAANPYPANGATIADTWVSLSWQPGIDAVLHDVYFGDNFVDVYNGAEGTFQGSQDSTTFIVGFPGFAYPDGLVPGTTYYWRVDEDDGLQVIMIQSLLKGVVWSFTVEAPQPQRPDPPINPSPINRATNQSINVIMSWEDGGGAATYDVYLGTDPTPDSSEYKRSQIGTSYDPGTLNSSTTYYWRIDAWNSSGTTTGDVWRFTTGAPPTPQPSKPINPSPINRATNQSINVVMRWENGGGATSYRVYFGTDPDPDSSEYKRSQTGTSYDPGTLNYSTTYYWRIDATNSSGTTTGDVWRFSTEEPPAIDGGVKAESPYPHNGAVDVPQSLTLRWRAGDGASMHDVYFGDSFANVNSGTGDTFQGSQDSATFVVGFPGFPYPDGLAHSMIYYWRVDEVEQDGTIHIGDVWSFTTAFFVVDDDFESFKDEDGWRISDTWIREGGATGPYTDQTIVFSGEQSMLFEYNNRTENVDYSEAKRTFDPPQDWTDEEALILFVYGRTDNVADTLYIEIEDDAGGAARVENPNPNVLRSDEWTPWRIPLMVLADQGIDLNIVETMSIGVGEPPEEPDGLLNDDCVNAIHIGNVTNLAFDTTLATFDGPGHCTTAPNIWYVYTATQSGGLTVSLCGSSYDTTLAVYDGSDCPPKLEDMLRCNDDSDSCGRQSEVEFYVTVGREYLIEIGGFGSITGQGVMNISYGMVQEGPPSNDDCDDAMSVGNVTNLRFDTTYATFDGPGYCMESPNIWYTYYADHTGSVTVSLCGSSYDSKLAVYNRINCPPSQSDLIECNDDFCGTNAQITFTAFAGSHYLIEVGAYNGETGQGVLNISSEDDLANPILRDGPKLFDNSGSGEFNIDSIVTAGADFRTLMGTLTWMNNNQPISGATVTLLGAFKNSPPTGSDGFYGVLCQVQEQTDYKANVTAPNLNAYFWVNFGDNWFITQDFEMP